MALFRCLKSKEVINYNTGADLGSSTTVTHTLPNTPIVAGSLEGTIYDGGVAIQTFEVDVFGAFTFHDINTPSTKVTAGDLNLGTGVVTLTWNNSPGSNSMIVSYVGLPVFQNVTMRLFKANCPKINRLCNTNSNGFVAAVTVCGQHLF